MISKGFGFAALALALLSPWFHSGADEKYYLLFSMGMVIGALVFLLPRKFPGSLRLPLASFVGFGVLALLTLIPVPFFLLRVLSPGLHDILQQLHLAAAHPLSWDPWWTVRTLAVYATAAGLVLIAHLMTGENHRRLPIFMNLLFWFGAIVAGYATISARFAHAASWMIVGEVQPWNFGPFANTNIFASYCLLLIPMGVALFVHALRHERLFTGLPLLYLPGLVVLGLALFSSHSLGGMSALIGAGAIYAFPKKPLWTLAGAAILLGGLAMVQPTIKPHAPKSLDERLHANGIALSLWTHSPLTGTGLGTVGMAAPLKQRPMREAVVDKIHDDYMELLCTGGLLGFLFFAGIIAWMARGLVFLRAGYTLRSGLVVGLLAVALHSFVDFPLQNLSVLGLFCIILGMVSSFHPSPPLPPLRGLKPVALGFLILAAGIWLCSLAGLSRANEGKASVWQIAPSLPLIRHNPAEGESMARHHALYAPVWGELSRAYEERKQYDRAVEAIEKACLLQPRNASLNLTAAKNYYLAGRDDQIVPALTRAYSVSPMLSIEAIPLSLQERESVLFTALPQAFRNYGAFSYEFYMNAYLLLKWWQSDRVLEMLRQAHGNLPHSTDLANDLAEELLFAGAVREGLGIAEGMFAESPNAKSCLLIAQADAALHREKEIRDWLYRGLGLTPGKNAWYVLQGAEILKPFAPEESLRLLQTGFHSDPDVWTAYVVGNIYVARKELWTAAEWFEKAYRVSPHFVAAYRNQIWVYKMLGENARAVQAAEEAKKFCPGEKWGGE